ncbi:MAG: response regulator transcription factor [Burkholderiales bacterium]
MASKQPRVILENDVVALTPKAQHELRGSATSLAPAALEVLVLIDGVATVGETAARARTLDRQAVVNILGNLLYDGYIAFARDQAGAPDLVDFFQTTGTIKPLAAASAKAKKESAATTLLLQQQGYVARIARRASAGAKADNNRTLSVLVVEDEPHLASLLKHVLASEGFEVRLAKNRDQIIAEFRRSPRPDLVLLDVSLPDADGFEVLMKIRQHPALQSMPVVMLTAKATRDAVLKGLAGGADGYITKPFEIDVLVKAVNVVLGLIEGGRKVEAESDPWLRLGKPPK